MIRASLMPLSPAPESLDVSCLARLRRHMPLEAAPLGFCAGSSGSGISSDSVKAWTVAHYSSHASTTRNEKNKNAPC